MNSNPIVNAVLTVTLFWYVFLSGLFYGANYIEGLWAIPSAMALGIAYMLGGAMAGAGFSFIIREWRRGNKAHTLLSKRDNRVIFSIGAIPDMRATIKSTNDSAENLFPKDLVSWYLGYQKRFPVEAQLMLRVARVLRAYNTIPASPVPGGHGGASLEAHSYNVLRAALELSGKWQYEGQKNKSGAITFPRIDPNYRFNVPEDPLVPLCALAHDIGKIECYSVEPDGRVREVKMRHDEEGGKMMGWFPEFKTLPRETRECISVCVSFYHHIMGIPQHIADRPRALAEFTILADMEAGKREGENAPETRYQHMEAPDAVNPEDARLLAEHMAALEKAQREERERASRAESKGRGGQRGETSSAVYGEDFIDRVAGGGGFMANHGETKKSDGTPSKNNVNIVVAAPLIPPDPNEFASLASERPDDREINFAMDAFQNVVLQANRLNSGKKENRLGYKSGSWVFVQDAEMRKVISSLYHLPDLMSDTSGHMHPFTRNLLWGLYEKGALYYRHENKIYSPRSALFTVQLRNHKGRGGEFKACIVFNAALFPELLAIPDAKLTPTVTAPFWGENKAFNKSGQQKTNIIAPTHTFDKNIPVESSLIDRDQLPGKVDPVQSISTHSTEVLVSEKTESESVNESCLINAREVFFPMSDIELADVGAVKTPATEKHPAAILFPEEFVGERAGLCYDEPILEGRWVTFNKGEYKGKRFLAVHV